MGVLFSVLGELCQKAQEVSRSVIRATRGKSSGNKITGHQVRVGKSVCKASSSSSKEVSTEVRKRLTGCFCITGTRMVSVGHTFMNF